MLWEISSEFFKSCAEHALERLVQFVSGTPHCVTKSHHVAFSGINACPFPLRILILRAFRFIYAIYIV